MRRGWLAPPADADQRRRAHQRDNNPQLDGLHRPLFDRFYASRGRCFAGSSVTISRALMRGRLLYRSIEPRTLTASAPIRRPCASASANAKLGSWSGGSGSCSAGRGASARAS